MLTNVDITTLFIKMQVNLQRGLTFLFDLDIVYAHVCIDKKTGIMPVTIKDIARQAGVSHTTVSRALNGNPSIPEKTSLAIRELAKELGYLPSAAARGLKTNKSHAIGVIVSRIDNPYFGEIVQGIEEVLQQTGYSLFIASSHLDFLSEKSIVQAFAEHRVDGVIISSVTFGKIHANFLKKYGMPIVVINNQSPDEYQCSIAHDDVDGGRNVARHLLSLEHKQIAYIGNASAERINEDRLLGFRAEIQRAGLQMDENLIINCDGSEIEDGIYAMSELLKRKPLPTAVFCFNDLMAIGALSELNARAIKVPEEISIVGFDNIPYSAFTNPPLTTFDQPKRMIGTEAAQMLLDILNKPEANSDLEPVTHIMRGHLLVRESTKTAKPRSS